MGRHESRKFDFDFGLLVLHPSKPLFQQMLRCVALLPQRVRPIQFTLTNACLLYSTAEQIATTKPETEFNFMNTLFMHWCQYVDAHSLPFIWHIKVSPPSGTVLTRILRRNLMICATSRRAGSPLRRPRADAFNSTSATTGSGARIPTTPFWAPRKADPSISPACAWSTSPAKTSSRGCGRTTRSTAGSPFGTPTRVRYAHDLHHPHNACDALD